MLNEDAEIEMLSLRRNPEVSSQMAALFAGDNANTLKTSLGRDATPGELYLAHFLGAWGATALMTAAEQDPHKPAAELLPAAAEANRTVFFSAGGLARTAEGVINWLKNKFTERLDETADVASMFDPMRARDWTAEEFRPQIEKPHSPFDVGQAARSGDSGQMGISLYLLQMLSDMFAAQPMQMVDDPFAMQPSGFSGGDWGSVLTQTFDSNSQTTAEAAKRAYQQGSRTEAALRLSQSA